MAIRSSSFLSRDMKKSKSIESSKISIDSSMVARSVDDSDLEQLSTELSSKSRISVQKIGLDSLSYDKTQAKY